MNLRTLVVAKVALLIGIAVVGCKQTVKANVDCKGAGNGISCDVQQTQGDAKVKVCWAVKVNCKNGTVVSGNSCGEVSGGGKTTVVLPAEKLENDDKCDAPQNMSVENVAITEA